MQPRNAAVVIADEAAPTGGRIVTYLTPDNRRVPVVFSSPQYSSAAVVDVGLALASGARRPPQGSRTNVQRERDRG